jgi:hypothetical protein
MEKIIEIIRRYGLQFFNGDHKEKTLRQLLEELNKILKLDIKFIFNENKELYYLTGGGRYNPNKRTIYLYKLSLMSLLHEFSHVFTASETEAQKMSHYLFKTALPDKYENARKKKLFHHFLSDEEIKEGEILFKKYLNELLKWEDNYKKELLNSAF